MAGKIVGYMLLLVIVLAAGGCGGDNQGSVEDKEPSNDEEQYAADEQYKAAAAAAGTILIQETEFVLSPTNVTLGEAGNYVLVGQNIGNATHALAIEGNDIQTETGEIEPGQSAELEVYLESGTYKIYCPVGDHEEQGMVGTITIL